MVWSSGWGGLDGGVTRTRVLWGDQGLQGQPFSKSELCGQSLTTEVITALVDPRQNPAPERRRHPIGTGSYGAGSPRFLSTGLHLPEI